MKQQAIGVVLSVGLLAGSGEPRLAAAAASEESTVALTVYNQNFALVKDVRVLTLARGTQEIRLDDVAALIDPTSVHFAALEHPGGVTVQEQNFQYDLAGADRLLTRYLNRNVTAVLKDGTTSEGNLLSFDGASLVLSGAQGGASIVNRTEVRDVRLGELPGGLVVKPTLVWMLESDRAGTERAEVSYLTDGVNWHAEYVAVVNEKDTGLTLDGWVSLDNQSGATYRNARLKLVAGDVHRAEPPRVEMMGRMDVATMAPKQFEEREFFEYHIYTLERTTTVADRETKQLSLIPTASAPAHKVLSFDGARDTKVTVKMEFDNKKESGLGLALPAGKVRVYKEDRDGSLEFVGEDRIDHTARDERVRLTLGNAFDVVGERKQTAHEQISDRVQEQSFEIQIRNHKTEAVEVVVMEHLYGDWKVLKNSHEYRKKDAFTLEFPVSVPVGGEATVTYTARSTW